MPCARFSAVPFYRASMFASTWRRGPVVHKGTKGGALNAAAPSNRAERGAVESTFAQIGHVHSHSPSQPNGLGREKQYHQGVEVRSAALACRRKRKSASVGML
jgi:hypothetical protein